MENPRRGRGHARGPNPPIPRQIQPQFRGPRPNQQEIRPPRVEDVGQIENRINNLERGNGPMLNDRAAIRGRPPIENGYFRLERPASSQMFYGKLGSRSQFIPLISNYFPITTPTDWSLYQYRVDFNPVQDRINIQRGLLSTHKKFLGAYIFDGTMLFSIKKFESDTTELISKRNTDDQTVIITLKFTSVIENDDYAFIQIFNLLIRHCLSHLKLTLVGKNYYDADAKINIPNHKLQLWPGYETKFGIFDCGLLLRSEISTKVIREDTVLDLLIECSNNRNRDPNWMITFKMSVIGSIVLTKFNNKTYRIDDIDEESNTRSTFLKQDGSSISFIDYYKEKYGINISNQQQPMLISKKKMSFRNEGMETELVYLVPELCIMTGITNKMSKNRHLMQDLAQYTRVNPTKRIIKYNNFIKRVLTTPKSLDSLKEWNLTLSNKLITVFGRVLPQQDLYGDNHIYPAGYNGDWSANLRSSPMCIMAKISCWTIVTPRIWSSDVGQFTNTLLRVANNLGFPLQRPRIVEIEDIHIRTYSVHLDRIINELNPSFILCVIKSSRNDLYSMIKRKLCVTRAVPSQVVLLKNVQKNKMSVCTKIVIQINCKLGGAPWRVVIPEPGMMILGFDIFHDKKSGKKPYGALIATMNDSHTSFFSCVDPFESEQELLSNFGNSIYKALSNYREKNHKLPNTIVIYRDGVGDGHLSNVHKIEVELVKIICEEFYADKKVGLAFIIVNKRISTRFFYDIEREGGRENYQNPPVGTVVDSSVTNPTMYDFYLVSQHVTNGTVTPTHYNVILDTLSETATIPITPNDMQQLTYKLTHMYYNWTGTIRVPAVCQLAHKLAFLAGQTLQSNPNPGLEDLLYFL